MKNDCISVNKLGLENVFGDNDDNLKDDNEYDDNKNECDNQRKNWISSDIIDECQVDHETITELKKKLKENDIELKNELGAKINIEKVKLIMGENFNNDSVEECGELRIFYQGYVKGVFS